MIVCLCGGLLEGALLIAGVSGVVKILSKKRKNLRGKTGTQPIKSS